MEESSETHHSFSSTSSPLSGSHAGKVLFYGGFLFGIITIASIAFLFADLIKLGGSRVILKSSSEFLSVYATDIIFCIVLLVSALLSFLCFKAAGAVDRNVIPDKDRGLLEEMIKQDEAPIDQYVRLSSLSGTTGFFTKLGLTGLPLATIGLTLIFTLLHMLTKSESLFDLAKLTLGAFLGSYVQRPNAPVVGKRKDQLANVPVDDEPPSSRENPYVNSGPSL